MTISNKLNPSGVVGRRLRGLLALTLGAGLSTAASAQAAQPGSTLGQRPALGSTAPPLDEASGQSGGVTRTAPPPTGDTTVNKSAPTPKGRARPDLGSTTPPSDEAAGEPGGVTRTAPPPSGPERPTRGAPNIAGAPSQ